MKALFPFVIKSWVVLFFAAGAAARGNRVVKDLDGNAVQIGQRYKIVPTMRPGTPLTYDYRSSNITCPNAVIRRFVGDEGTPLTFEPFRGEAAGSVLKNTDLDVIFRGPKRSKCTKSYMWAVGRVDEANRRVVTIGGSKATNKLTVSRGFRIFDYRKDSYSFKFCTTYVGRPTECRNIGIGLDGQTLVEVDTVQPFEFKIKKL